MNASCFCQADNVINDRHVFFYLLSSAIGNVFVIQYEQQTKELTSKLFYNELDKAESYYKAVCRKILDGKL